MKAMLFILVTAALSLHAEAQTFGKRVTAPSHDFVIENKTQAVTLESKLQIVRGRSADSMRFSAGIPTEARYIGAIAQAEWTRRITPRSPLTASAGVGYLLETRAAEQNSSRNFHHLPVFITAGYGSRLVGPVYFHFEAGPVVRHIFERGYTLEQSNNYAYGDALLQAGVDYQWIEPITTSGRFVGIRLSRLFGLAGRDQAPAQDSVLASFGFDL